MAGSDYVTEKIPLGPPGVVGDYNTDLILVPIPPPPALTSAEQVESLEMTERSHVEDSPFASIGRMSDTEFLALLTFLLLFIVFSAYYIVWKGPESQRQAVLQDDDVAMVAIQESLPPPEPVPVAVELTATPTPPLAPAPTTADPATTNPTVATVENTLADPPVALPPSPDFAEITLKITTAPFMAKLSLDGEPLGTAPFNAKVPIQAAGTHEIVAEFAFPDFSGYTRLHRKTHSFTAKASEVAVGLAPDDFGMLEITAIPIGAGFFLEGFASDDNEKQFPLKITAIVAGQSLALPYGEYHVSLYDPNTAPADGSGTGTIRYQKDITIGPDEPTLSLAVSEREFTTFTLSLDTDPVGAAVWLDGKEIGVTPFEDDVAMGTHQVRVSKKGHADATFSVASETHAVLSKTVSLTPETPAMLIKRAETVLKKNPANALVLLEQVTKMPGADMSRIQLVIGKIRLEQKQFSEALTAFQASLSGKAPRNAATLGMVRAHLGLGDPKAAYALLVPFLSTHPGNREAKGLFAQAAGSKAVVLITSDPPAASVTVGATKLIKTSPVIVAELDAQNYPIKIEKAGYKTLEINKELKAGEFVAVKARLELAQ